MNNSDVTHDEDNEEEEEEEDRLDTLEEEKKINVKYLEDLLQQPSFHLINPIVIIPRKSYGVLEQSQ
jgi:hypothetical protein